MNKMTCRNKKKEIQLDHIKKKLGSINKTKETRKSAKDIKKKTSLVKSLKNLRKRLIRKNIK
jgi:hypothetical protein